MRKSFTNLILLLAFFATTVMAADTGEFINLHATYDNGVNITSAEVDTTEILASSDDSHQQKVVKSVDEKWTKMPGSNVKAIAGGGTKVMMINNSNDLYEWNYKTAKWMRTARKATDVAIDHENTIWTVEPSGDVYAFYPGTGKKVKTGSKGKAIGAGGTKTMMANTNNDLYEWNYKTKKWMRTGRKAVDVAVDDQETIWTIKPDFSIHRFYPKTGEYNQRAGYAKVIGAGGSGRVAALGNDGSVFLYERVRRNGINLGYKASDVGVDYKNHIWIASTDGSVYRYN